MTEQKKETNLKTLNDMNLFFSTRKKLEEEFYEYTKKDRVDNTVIKDCPMNVIGWFQGKRDEQIRQEAIKWIKESIRVKKMIDERPQITRGDIICRALEDGKINILTHFFNLTEEDLK